MSILDLSADILLTIAESCRHRDVYSLARCCRELHSILAKNLAKHHRVWRYWNTVATDNAKKPFHELLLKITRKPHLAQYIETLECHCDDPTGLRPIPPPAAYTPSEIAELVKNLETFPRTGERSVDALQHQIWQQDYLNGFHTGRNHILAGYLLYIALSLRTLVCYAEYGFEGADLLPFIMGVVNVSSDIGELPLQQLQTLEVRLDTNVTEGGMCADWLVAAMNLPRLKTFAATRMNSRLQFFTLDHVPKSDISKIILQASLLEPEVLIGFLSKTTSLKSFAYDCGIDSLVAEEGSFSPKRITAALIEYAGHTLEHLTLHGTDDVVSAGLYGLSLHMILTRPQSGQYTIEVDGARVVESETQWLIGIGEEIPFVSLAGFQHLKSLKCSTSLLTGDPEFIETRMQRGAGGEYIASLEDHCRAAESIGANDFMQATPTTLRRLAFVSRLPQSLRALQIEDYPCHIPLAYSALSELVQKADILLPRLKRMYLNQWSAEYFESKGLLNVIQQKGLKYKELPDPFQAGCDDDYDSESDHSLEVEDEDVEYDI